MASIKFYGTQINAASPGGTLIPHEAGSGLGLYGAGYAVSVPILGKQDTTWLTNSNGTSVERIQMNNTKHVSSTQVSINGASAVNLGKLPNLLCPLNIRFEHSTPVRVQNCKARAFDRNNIANHASGVTTYLYEARHPSNNQAVDDLDHKGRALEEWYEFDPSEPMSDMTWTNSPGISGVNTNSNDTNPALGYLSNDDSAHTSLRHDWYGAISVSPEEIGSKLFALYFSVEYL
jgi:hypothetical protein